MGENLLGNKGLWGIGDGELDGGKVFGGGWKIV